ncbi:hypothetical protein POM88_041427 [Heracleum sosnowskyi]|uniref:Brf1 TBP-binding domain-containing protein n=1 Tax=Heracleum sosnowskyi TaxID=360622 RepID=A0AAD8M9Q2_9APIA|nr:hypothetical protein POM88_041427 [Heracleum sosnowskyi]
MGSNGLWCNNCAMFHRTQLTDDAKLCCSFCGKVLSEYNCLEEVPFAKNAARQGVRGTNRDEKVHFRENAKTGGATKHVAVNDSDSDESHGSNKLRGESGEESDTLSDIDDLEIDSYFHSEKEKHYKKIIWEELNREYIEGQKRGKEARNPVPNRTAAEAARKMLAKKSLESKINYAVLDGLFNESNAMKSRSGEGGTKAKRKIDGKMGSEADMKM